MRLSPVFLREMKNGVERILHMPGSFTGKVPEMTVVIDHSLTKAQVLQILPELLRVLKQHSEVFRNVRLNVVDWLATGEMKDQVCPMTIVMLDSFYESYEQRENSKDFTELVEHLKLFHARSKIVFLLTDGGYPVKDWGQLRQQMQPFLIRKLLQVEVTGETEPFEVKLAARM